MSDTTSAVTKLDDCHYRVDLTVPADQVDRAFKQTRQRVRANAKIPGFRPGKAPDRILEKRFGAQIVEETHRSLLQTNLMEQLQSDEFEAVTTPTICDEFQDTKPETGKDFALAVEFDVKPEFELPDYRGIQLRAAAMPAVEEQVERMIERMREQRADIEKVERPAEAGDMLQVTYKAALTPADLTDGDEDDEDAEDIPTGGVGRMLEAEETWLLLREPEMIPGVTEGLAGLEAGQEKELDVQFPDDFFEPLLAGRQTTYSFTVHEVHGQKLPEVDDDFAKGLGAEDLDSLRDNIRQHVTSEIDGMRQGVLRGRASQKLVELADDFPLPPNLLQQEEEIQRRQLERRQADNSQEADESQNKSEDELKAEAHENACSSLRLRFLAEKIAEAEDISVAPNELNQRVEQFRAGQQLDPEEFREQFDIAAIADHFHQELLREHVADCLVEHAEIEEIDVDEDDTESEADANVEGGDDDEKQE